MTEGGPAADPRRHCIEAPDGQVLDVLELEPTVGAVATVVAGHAMMVDRRTLWRPDRASVVGTLVDRGCRVFVPALRGHPPSGPLPAAGGDWTYDQLVADTPLYIDLALQVAPSEPLFLLGHSLFGHTSLAFLGRHPAHPASRAVAGVITLAASVWGARNEASRRRRWARRLVTELVGVINGVVGYVPARQTRFGTADEAHGYWDDFVRVVRTSQWRSRDGFDYWAGLARVTCAVLWVLSDGDWLSPPSLTERFGAPLPRRRVFRVGADSRADLVVKRPPSHMGLVASAASRPIWEAVADWIVERAAKAANRETTAAEPAS